MMLHTTSGLSRSVVKWVSQVTVSVGATLVATMIYSALPKPAFFAGPVLQPELTSGGKFAARAITPIAYDGLDAMPLPHVAPLPVVATPLAAGAPVPVVPTRRVAWDDAAPLVLVPERPARATRSMRAVARVEPRRAVTTAEAPASAPLPGPAEPVSDARADDGFLPRIVPKVVPRILPTMLSAARDAWSLTASAGSTLVAHVVPQIP